VLRWKKHHCVLRQGWDEGWEGYPGTSPAKPELANTPSKYSVTAVLLPSWSQSSTFTCSCGGARAGEWARKMTGSHGKAPPSNQPPRCDR
jgi:hypothetical protein